MYRKSRTRRVVTKRGLRRQKRKNRKYNSFKIARGGIRL